jgi:hypothetical protein
MRDRYSNFKNEEPYREDSFGMREYTNGQFTRLQIKKLINQLKNLKNKIMGNTCKFKIGDEVVFNRKIYTTSGQIGDKGKVKNVVKATTSGKQHLHYVTFTTKGGATYNAYDEEIDFILSQKEQLLKDKKELNESKKVILEKIKDIDGTLKLMEKHGLDELTPELEKVFLIAGELEELDIDIEKAERIARILSK